jgi:PTH1 family peptidyl-tRNA hydrolase
MIRLVAGLGNPGKKYIKTRHNLGFMVVERLADKYESGFRKKKGDFRQSSVAIGSGNVILIKPTTFMNLSGVAVRQAADYHGFRPSEILIVSDDINLPLGKIRIRSDGSDGGHKGLKSVIQELGSEEFRRVRLGIGLPEETETPIEAYVLEKFSEDEQKTVEKMIEIAVSAVEKIIQDGVEAAQVTYN